MAKAKHRTFVKTIDGTEYVQVAHTPADAVALTFNGWQERADDDTKPAASPTPAAKKSTTTAAAGKSSGSK